MLPSACANGSQHLTERAPSVRFLTRDFDVPESWRTNLGLNTKLGEFGISLNGVLSLNTHQPSIVDLNVARTPAFRLSSESDRPVFVPIQSIDQASGALSLQGTRQVTEFGPVLAIGSGGVSRVGQVDVTVSREIGGHFYTRASLTGATGRERTTGFGRATKGDPFGTRWSPLDELPAWTGRWELAYSRGGRTISVFARGASGRRFAPLVLGDINGDGWSGNDLAFIPPAKGATPLAAEMAGLLERAPSHVVSCLQRQMGGIAEQGSCRAKPTVSLDGQLRLSPTEYAPITPGGSRIELTVHVSNMLGGLDRLLHGSRPRGWGTPGLVDPNLLVVQGFEPETQQFRYAVNPRFGRSDATWRASHNPFRVSINASIYLGRSMPEQQVDRSLRPGRHGAPGPRLSAEVLFKRYVQTLPDPFSDIIVESDSLLLQDEQLVRLREMHERYRERADSVWYSLASIFADLPDDFDAHGALRLQEEATNEVRRIGWEEIRRVATVLTPIQLGLLPREAGWLYNQKVPPRHGMRTLIR